MSLRDTGGEEECFECSCWEEERKLACEQQDTLDLVEAGNCCGFPTHITHPFPVYLPQKLLF